MTFDYGISPIRNGFRVSFTFAQGLATGWPSFAQAFLKYLFLCTSHAQKVSLMLGWYNILGTKITISLCVLYGTQMQKA